MTYRKFMVKNFVGLEGVKLSTLDKYGKFKPARTISWLKAGPRTFFIFVLYGIQKIITSGDIVWWDIPFLLAIAFCVYAGFIYPRLHPLLPEEANDVEKENQK